ncbi:MAG: hypothetical protein ACLRVT_01685 [Oscillospiraceae bacterium]
MRTKFCGIHRAVSLTIRQLAARCSVGYSTVCRFCEQLGFQDTGLSQPAGAGFNGGNRPSNQSVRL